MRDVDVTMMVTAMFTMFVLGIFSGYMHTDKAWRRDISAGKVKLQTQVITNVVIEVELK